MEPINKDHGQLPILNFRFSIVLKYLLLGIVLALLIGVVNIAWLVFSPLASEQMVLKVAPGDNARAIATKLFDNGIIRSRRMFILMAKLRGTDRKLHAGAYSFGGYYDLNQTIALLEQGNTESIRITFPEGMSLYKTLKRIERSGLASYDSLYIAATDTAFVYRLTGFKAESLEGFLFPDTYRFGIGSSVESILSAQVQEFFGQLNKAGIDPIQTKDFYRVLTLASIVEKESAHPDERVIIAGVFLNRMKINMRLESCPTVDYILERRGVKREVLTQMDINTPSPYNTYLKGGLPPSPICNPSLEAIRAVLKPAKSSYLYFVSNREGRNDFSSSYAEHLRKKHIYNRKR